MSRPHRVPLLEVLATVLLALATVATAWSGYQASRWNGEQAKAAARARTDVRRSTNHVLGVVLLAASLFFAGISTTLDTPRLRAVLLGLGAAVFLGTVAWLATSPISVGV